MFVFERSELEKKVLKSKKIVLFSKPKHFFSKARGTSTPLPPSAPVPFRCPALSKKKNVTWNFQTFCFQFFVLRLIYVTDRKGAYTFYRMGVWKKSQIMSVWIKTLFVKKKKNMIEFWVDYHMVSLTKTMPINLGFLSRFLVIFGQKHNWYKSV